MTAARGLRRTVSEACLCQLSLLFVSCSMHAFVLRIKYLYGAGD